MDYFVVSPLCKPPLSSPSGLYSLRYHLHMDVSRSLSLCPGSLSKHQPHTAVCWPLHWNVPQVLSPALQNPAGSDSCLPGQTPSTSNSTPQ